MCKSLSALHSYNEVYIEDQEHVTVIYSSSLSQTLSINNRLLVLLLVQSTFSRSQEACFPLKKSRCPTPLPCFTI